MSADDELRKYVSEIRDAAETALDHWSKPEIRQQQLEDLRTAFAYLRVENGEPNLAAFLVRVDAYLHDKPDAEALHKELHEVAHAVATGAPLTSPEPASEALRDAIRQAYEQGCIDTHRAVQNEPELARLPLEDAEFGEAADDYATGNCPPLAQLTPSETNRARDRLAAQIRTALAALRPQVEKEAAQ
jgi:hypothetical protein